MRIWAGYLVPLERSMRAASHVLPATIVTQWQQHAAGVADARCLSFHDHDTVLTFRNMIGLNRRFRD